MSEVIKKKLILAEDESVSVIESDALLKKAFPPAPMSVSVIESDADINPLNMLDTESARVIESEAAPENSRLTLLLNGAVENGEKPNIV